jgi:hypothetical protein
MRPLRAVKCISRWQWPSIRAVEPIVAAVSVGLQDADEALEMPLWMFA